MMAMPWFKIKDLAKCHGIVALSSNYTLYADLTNRVMALLSQFAPEQEVYSIDESVLGLTGMATDHTVYGQQMRVPSNAMSGFPSASVSHPARFLPNSPTMSPRSRPGSMGSATSMPWQKRSQVSYLHKLRSVPTNSGAMQLPQLPAWFDRVPPPPTLNFLSTKQH